MKDKKLQNRIYTLLLVMGLILSPLGARAETLPVVGPSLGPVNTTEETDAPATADPTESAEEPLPSDDPTEEQTTEELTTEEPTTEEPETEAPTELAGPALSVDQVLSLRKNTSSEITSVDVNSERSGSSGGSVLEGMLLAKRLMALAEASELNMIVYCGNTYVNIRSEAAVSSDLLGKIYYHSVAEVLDTVYTENGIWYHIRSGSVEGYVKSEFFVSGAEAVDILSSILTPYATIINDAQRLYKGPSESSDTLTALSSGVKYRVLSYDANFVKIFYGESGYGAEVSGYVPTWSVSISQDLPYAVSLEEENLNIQSANLIVYQENSRAESRYQSSVAASVAYESWLAQSRWAAYSSAEASRQALESWLAESSRKAAEAEARWRSQQAAATSASQALATTGQAAVQYYSQYIPAGTSALRRAIVQDALQYVGVLQYKWGGESLIYGADCSGFLKAIFANHGISLDHYSYTIAKTGIKVWSIAQARPGDILCYRTDNPAAGRGHVVMYIGSGYVVHSPSTGNKVRVNPASTTDLHTIQNVIGD